MKEEDVKKLTDEIKILKNQLARVGAMGDEKKEALLRKILESNPHLYDEVVYDDTFEKITQ